MSSAKGAGPGRAGRRRAPLSARCVGRLKISHLDCVFLSRLAWANVGGLPGERRGGAPGGQGAGLGPAAGSERGAPGGRGAAGPRGCGEQALPAQPGDVRESGRFTVEGFCSVLVLKVGGG